METKALRTQQEVWEWKEAAYNSLKHIPEEDRITHILSRVESTIAQIKDNQSRSGRTVTI